MAYEVTKAFGGAGIWDIEFFIMKDDVIFSELSPRPHDTGIETLEEIQNLNEFELHARAILGYPIPKVELLKTEALAMLLANKISSNPRSFKGIKDVLKV